DVGRGSGACARGAVAALHPDKAMLAPMPSSKDLRSRIVISSRLQPAGIYEAWFWSRQQAPERPPPPLRSSAKQTEDRRRNMLKALLLGGALALAAPAFAQTPAAHGSVNAGTAQTTAHDPLQTAD